MKKLSIFVVTAILPCVAMAGAPPPIPVPVDEPGVLGLFLLAGAVVAAIKLQAKFRK